MPTYQYACTECGAQLEVVQKFSDDPLTDCPTCHGRLRKLFSAVGVVFKGSGFYKTDSRSSGKPGSGGSASGEGAGSSPAKESKDPAPSTTTGSSSTSATSGSTPGSAGSTGGSSKVA